MDSCHENKDNELYCISGRIECQQEQQRVQALEISEARYQNLFESVKDAIVSVDCAGLVVRANKACEQVLGWSAQALLGKSLGSLFAPQLAEAFSGALVGKASGFEQEFVWPNGRQVILALQLAPILTGQEISGVLIVARDLTLEKSREAERVRLYQELQISHKALGEKARALELSQQQLQQAMAEQEKVNVELRELGRLKSDFIGVASHELRTPLTFLLGSLEYLEESLPGKLDQDERDLLDYAMQGSRRLSDIVENMLDIVRFESESFQPQKHEVSLFQVLQLIRKDLSSLLQERQVTLDFGAAEQWPEFLLDPLMVRRALENVIENAIRYTESGGQIHVSGRICRRTELQEQAAQIKVFRPDFPGGIKWQGDFFSVCIRDNGIGIPRQQQVQIFEHFCSVGNLHEHGSGSQFKGRGAGLGLALVKRILQGHDGVAWVQSPGSQAETGLENPGSCFYLLFPFEKNRPLSVPVSAELSRILLIDDDRAIRRFVEVVLRDRYELELAASGEEGLKKAVSFRPDLILLDLYMPEMDGLKVCAELQADARTRHIPIAIFTALSGRHEKENALAVGAVDYITKPFLPKELIARIDLLLLANKGINT